MVGGMVGCSTTGTDDQAPITEVVSDLPANLVWVSDNGSSATVVEQKLKSITIKKSRFLMDYEPLNWLVIDNVDSMLCVFVLRNGNWTGGRVEWNRPGRKDQTAANFPGGYIKGVKPIEGEDVLFVMVSIDKKVRSNAMHTQWHK